jgi:nucleoside-diphosphate-sugar epimerase
MQKYHFLCHFKIFYNPDPNSFTILTNQLNEMIVSILGCGWYGKALAEALIKNGVSVKGSITSPEKFSGLRDIGILPYLVKFGAAQQVFDPAFFSGDVLVVSIPPKLRAGEGGGYLPRLKFIIAACKQYCVKKVIYISSTGVYGEHNQAVTELDHPKPDTASGAVLLEAEQLFQQETLFKTTIIRFGGLIGPGRHPGRFFAGKTNIPNGLAPVNLIHQSDCIGISLAIIKKDVFGYLFNACSPDHPEKGIFYSEMAIKAGLVSPQFIPELNNWKVVGTANLKRLLKYSFKVNDLHAESVIY